MISDQFEPLNMFLLGREESSKGGDTPSLLLDPSQVSFDLIAARRRDNNLLRLFPNPEVPC